MPTAYGAFDENGKPIRSTSNPAFTGTPTAPPVLRELPTPAPDRLFNPNAMPQLPGVQPQARAPSLMQRAADFVMPPAGAATLDQPVAAGVPAVRAIQPRSMMGIPAMAAPSRQEPVAHALPSRGAMGVPANGIPLPHSASGGIGKPRNYIGEGSQYEPAPAQPQMPPDIAPRVARESGPMDFPANVVPHYRMGDNGALQLAMPGGGTAELTPAPGSNRLAVRATELAGQRLGGGQFETDAQVAARRPDLYGADGRPLLVGAFGNAVDQGLDRQLVEARALTQALRDSNPRGGDPVIAGGNEPPQLKLPYGRPGDRAKRRDMLEAAQLADNRAARGALLQQQAGAQADRLAMDIAQLRQQGLLAQAQDSTTRRGQDMQLLGREKRNPVSVKTADGGEVLFDPGSGQWLQPPGAQSGGLGKQDADRLKGITGHIGKAMGMDSAANPIDAAAGAAYTAASRIGGGAYMATRGVRQFAGYTDADFAGIGQDVAAGRAAIRTGKDGMAYAIYHGEDGKAYGVPIGPAENYANIQPAAGQPAAAR